MGTKPKAAPSAQAWTLTVTAILLRNSLECAGPSIRACGRGCGKLRPERAPCGRLQVTPCRRSGAARRDTHHGGECPPPLGPVGAGPGGCRPHGPMRVPAELAAGPGRPSQLSKMETLRVTARWEPSRHTWTLSRLSSHQPRVDAGPCARPPAWGLRNLPGSWQSHSPGAHTWRSCLSPGPERAGPFKASVCPVVSGRDGTEAPEDGERPRPGRKPWTRLALCPAPAGLPRAPPAPQGAGRRGGGGCCCANLSPGWEGKRPEWAFVSQAYRPRWALSGKLRTSPGVKIFQSSGNSLPRESPERLPRHTRLEAPRPPLRVRACRPGP